MDGSITKDQDRRIFLQSYLAQTEIVDWSHPEVWSLAKELGDKNEPGKIAARCFDWVQDQVRHSVDHKLHP